MKKHILIVALFFTFTIIKAQQPIVRNFSTALYNSGTQNWCIGRSSDSKILFANNNGLLTFDSEKWQTYNITNYTNVRSILCDKTNHLIYAGASNEFGYYKNDPPNFILRYHSMSNLLPEKERNFDEVWNIHKIGNDIYFQCKKVVFIFNQNGKIRIIHTPYRIETSAVIDNRLIIACKEQVLMIKDKRLSILPNTMQIKGMSIRAILPYKGMILFATASNGLYLYNNGKMYPYVTDMNTFLKEEQIFCGAIHKDMLAFGTVRGGLIMKNLKTGQTSYSNNYTGLQNNTILSLMFDEANNIWLGLDQGIAYVLSDVPYKELLGKNSQVGSGYASLVIGNKIYLGTNQGLFVMPYPLIDSPIPTIPRLLPGMTGQVWCIRNINGTIFCGNNDGAFIVNGFSVKKISGAEGTWDFKELHQHKGYILSCDYQGLYLLKNINGQWKFSNRIKGFSETSGSFEEDRDGSIWLSHWQKGIYHLWLNKDMTKVVKTVLYNKSNNLVVDGNNIFCKINGNIYISSVDGFYSYDRRTDKLKKEPSINKIFNSYGETLKLLETPAHDLWAIKGYYLAIAHTRKNGEYTVDTLSYRNIAKSLQYSLGHISYIDAGHTLFNSESGFLIVDNNHKPNKCKNDIYIRRITGTNSKDTIIYEHSPSSENKIIEIEHDQNSIKIEYIWPEYEQENAVDYSCLLENYDKGWSNPSHISSKEYTHLQKDTYVFRVRAYNRINGNEEETRITIKILPAWYETWFAYFIYIILLVVVFYYILKYIKYRSDKKVHAVELEKERQLREKEALFEIKQEKNEKEMVKLKNEQLEVELKHKSSELADSTMNLIRKNDMLLSLDNDISELSDSLKREEAKAMVFRKIHNIRQNIQSNIKEDENWEKFEENFNLVYDNYMKKLCKNFPNLKINDRKLCAYLRMGLSSKEIASLMNTSVRSIETARYRLRKKLNLDRDDNLSSFIQEL